jgi:hypothetical protein
MPELLEFAGHAVCALIVQQAVQQDYYYGYSSQDEQGFSPCRVLIIRQLDRCDLGSAVV